jgi:hypothetical protein
VKNFLTVLLKLILSASIVAYLVWDAVRGKGGSNVFSTLVSEPKNWGFLIAAWAILMAGTLLLFVRWWCLVRALGVPCRLRDAIRIAFWGMLFNLAPLGVVAGDLVKAFMLAHEHREHQASAVASVLIDRVIGLWSLFVFATITILLTGFWTLPAADIRWICYATFLATGVGTVGIMVMFAPDAILGRGVQLLAHIPRVGHMIQSLVEAMRMYRHRPFALAGACLMSFAIQTISVVTCYWIARGLPGEVLSLRAHSVIIPLSIVAGVVPLPMGPFEFVIEFLYTHIPAGVTIATGQGLVVALAYRLITVLVAATGVASSLGSRRELAEAIHDMDEKQAVSDR